MDACACNPGEGKEEGPIPNPPPNTTPDPPANPKDPCGQAQIMTSDVGLNSRMVDLQSRINPNTEEGYMIDANGTIHPVPDSLKGKDYLYFEFDAFKKYTEANHSHHTGDVLGFDPGDLHVHYQFYKMNKMVDVNTFRFMITLEGQAICLQITNEAAYKAFTKKHNLWKGDSDLHEAITIFFKENGIDDIQEQDTAPTRTFEELTSTLVSFFAAQENGAGISVSVGKRNGGQIEWEAKEKDSAATTSSTPPKMKKRCN